MARKAMAGRFLDASPLNNQLAMDPARVSVTGRIENPNRGRLGSIWKLAMAVVDVLSNGVSRDGPWVFWQLSKEK